MTYTDAREKALNLFVCLFVCLLFICLFVCTDLLIRRFHRSASDTISSLGGDPELGTVGPGQLIRGGGEGKELQS